MLAEDVVAALNEMGICDVKVPKRKKKTSDDANGVVVPDSEDSDMATMTISRAKVLKWSEEHRVDLIPPVREEGFLGEWALSDVDNDEDEGGGDEEGDK